MSKHTPIEEEEDEYNNSLMARTPDIVNKEFELEMPDVNTGGCSVLMVGGTRAGKSTALKHILDKYFKTHIGIIFSQSARADAYKDMNYKYIKKSKVYIPELVRAMYKINSERDNYYPFISIIDDCPLVRNDKELLKLATIYRNSGLSSITSVQVIGMLPPTVRANINFILLFKCNNTEATEKTIKAFLRGYLPNGWNYDTKIAWYKKATEDHHFLFIDNLAGTICRCKIKI
jgi:hypothetical protein